MAVQLDCSDPSRTFGGKPWSSPMASWIRALVLHLDRAQVIRYALASPEVAWELGRLMAGKALTAPTKQRSGWHSHLSPRGSRTRSLGWRHPQRMDSFRCRSLNRHSLTRWALCGRWLPGSSRRSGVTD